jgi:predicted amidohydrolase
VASTRRGPLEYQAACLQFDVRRDDVALNSMAVTTGLRAAAAGGARLVVLPELWTTSFPTAVSDTLLAAATDAEQQVERLSAELNLIVVGSSLERDGGRLFNRARIVESGRVLANYRKIHLFSPNAEPMLFAGGDEPVQVECGAGRLGVLICYDIRFPELVRWYFHKRVDVLAVPAQWPEARAGHWRALLTARAIENQMFVVGCNRTGVEPSLRGRDQLRFPGDSRVVDPMGEVLAAGAGENGPVSATIETRKAVMIRRILPIARDRRPSVYQKLWLPLWSRE